MLNAHKKTSLVTIFIFTLIHGVALFGAYPYFSLEGVALLIATHAIFCMSITVVYHRYLTHSSFKAGPIMHYIMVSIANLAGEGSPTGWVVVHRDHHLNSDIPGKDPHTPDDGFCWSHIFWMTKRLPKAEWEALCKHHAPKLYTDPYLRFLSKTYVLWHIASAFLIYWAGRAYAGHEMGMSFLVYGFFIRTMLVWHTTWLINSGTHVFGSRPHNTKGDDHSGNSLPIAIITYGEGWHANHHYDPTNARAGFLWWQIDMSYWVIWCMKKLHLIWDVKDKIPEPPVET
jgi:fatty-acid desaturase